MSLSRVWPQAHAEDQGRRRIGDYDEPLRINGIDDLKAHAGEDLGVTSWHDVTQTVGAVDSETLMLAYAS
jgi:hypothetical protein